MHLANLLLYEERKIFKTNSILIFNMLGLGYRLNALCYSVNTQIMIVVKLYNVIIFTFMRMMIKGRFENHRKVGLSSPRVELAIFFTSGSLIYILKL